MTQSDDFFPPGFDAVYFSTESWATRVDNWLRVHKDEGFSRGNVEVIRQVLSDPETGIRMVVNITADALRSFLQEGVYRNLYDNPLIGGTAREVSEERARVDATLGITPDTYFGALALGGTGVRFYGEYCMVLGLTRIPAATRLFDRDSYDILNEPLKDLDLLPEHVDCLRGAWSSDAIDMALMRVLPQIAHNVRLVTSGTVSESVLRDQEFMEIHLDGTFGPGDLDEVRQSPDDAATELSIAERDRQGLFTTLVERLWMQRRADVARDLDAAGVLQRVVTLHGRGYQWK
jgi:hypothetical protein